MSIQVPRSELIDERLISVEGQQPSLEMGADDLKHLLFKRYSISM
jgi:hypothetical protein